jgi:transcriptional repressor NrdR
MVQKVKKRSGKTEVFIREKIVVACLKAGAPVNLARTIADDIEGSQARTLDTSEIRDRVVEQLGNSNPEYRDAWIMYERQRGRI